MKKFFILFVAAVAAALTLTAAVSAPDSASASGHWEGTVSFESAAMPALNCSMPLGRVASLYELAPENINGLCAREYETIRQRLRSSSSFTYQGVRVRKLQDSGKTVTLELSFQGYKLTVKDALWEDLDHLFASLNGEG